LNPSPRRITIVTGNPLCHNPRVVKEAQSLAGAGYHVEVLGGWLDTILKVRDADLLQSLPFRFTPVLDATAQPQAWAYSRLRVRLAREWHRRTGREAAWQLGYVTQALLRAARRRQAHTDLFIAHSEPALWAISQLQNQKSGVRNWKCQMGVDMEDWFSEDLPPEMRRHRPVKLLKSLERGILSRAVHATCTSRVMSEALAKEYGCRPPTVIYNAFPWRDRQTLDGKKMDRRDLRVPSIHWYSQSLGTDRGLGDLFAALSFLKGEAEIHLRGKPVNGFEDWLTAHVPENWRKRVFIHGLVSNSELLSRIAEHDIGFAGEQGDVSRNRELTVTNKILHYLLGGLAVVASDTTGQREIATHSPIAVRIYPSGNAEFLANELNALLANNEVLRSSKSAALAAAKNEFCWERQISGLLQSLQGAFK
jgi:glycosyltransferase involved in cell wall biosynthesis